MIIPLSKVNSLSLKEAALTYADYGFYVFPLTPGGKTPLTGTRGVHDATIAQRDIELWWTVTPNANIGLAGGRGAEFLDLDVKREGQNGVLSWLEIGGSIWDRPVQETPTGGLHIALPGYDWAGLKCFVDKGLYGGMDMRTSGGYVVGAPSVVNGKRYRWRDGDLKDIESSTLTKLIEYSSNVKRYSGASAAEMDGVVPDSMTSETIRQILSQRLPEHLSRFCLQGINWRPDGDDSAAAWVCVRAMFKVGLTPQEVMAILPDTYLIEMAGRHASGDPFAWLWRYTATSAWQSVQADLERDKQMLPGPVEVEVPATGDEWVYVGADADEWVYTGAEKKRPVTDTGQHHFPENANVGSTGQVNYSEILRQRMLAIPADALDPTQRLEKVLQDMLGMGFGHSQIEDLLAFAAKNTPVKLGVIRKLWGELCGRANAKQQRQGLEPAEVFVVSQNKILNRMGGSFCTREAFLIEKAPQFGGDKAKTEEAYLTGADRLCPVVQDITYDPGQPHGIIRDTKGVERYNMYRGSSVLAKEGDVGPWLGLLDSLNIEGGPEVRDAVLDWMAHCVQNPGEKVNHALLMGGAHGIGKDSFFHPFWDAVGRGNVEMIRGEELCSDFSGYLAGRKVLCVQEIEFGDHRDSQRISAKLKPIIAAPPDVLRINEKNLREYSIPNVVQLVAFSNHRSRPIHMDPGERRWLCLWCQREQPTGTDVETWSQWFEQYYTWLENGGTEAIMHYLLSRDVSRYNPRKPPMITPWTIAVQDAGRSPLNAWLLEQIAEGNGPFAWDVVRFGDVLKMARFAQASGEIAARNISNQTLRKAMVEIGTQRWRIRSNNLYIIRNKKEVQKEHHAYWTSVFMAVDAEGFEAARAMTREQILQYTKDREGIHGGIPGGNKGEGKDGGKGHPDIRPSWY